MGFEKPLISSFILGQLVATAQLLEESMKEQDGSEDKAPTIAELLLNEVIENPRAAMIQLQYKLHNLEEHFKEIQEQGLVRDLILINKIKGRYRIPNQKFDEMNEEEYLSGYFKQLRKYFAKHEAAVSIENQQEQVLLDVDQKDTATEELEHRALESKVERASEPEAVSEPMEETTPENVSEEEKKQEDTSHLPVISSQLLGQWVATAQLLEEFVNDLKVDKEDGPTVSETFFGDVLENPKEGLEHIEARLDEIEKRFKHIEYQGLVRDLRLIRKIKGQYHVPSVALNGEQEEEFLQGYLLQKKKYVQKPAIAPKLLGQLLATAQLIEEGIKAIDTPEDNSLTVAENTLHDVVNNPRLGLKRLDHKFQSMEPRFSELPSQRLVRDFTLIGKIRKQYTIPNQSMTREEQEEYLQSYYDQISKYFIED